MHTKLCRPDPILTWLSNIWHPT